MTKPFEDRTREEIAFYRDVDNVDDLPPIYGLWSEHVLVPRLRSLGFASLDALWTDSLASLAQTTRQPLRVVSLGAGNCNHEIRLAQCLLQQGVRDFTIECLEISAHMIERGRQAIAAQGLGTHLTVSEADLNTWQPSRSYDACFANHSLHHIVELEHAFDSVRAALLPHGLFLVNDMIGRNGHMRWPEALTLVDMLWATLPERCKYNHQMKRSEPEFVNWDCSTQGFEGIRAQDILPLLVRGFSFDVFLGYANVIGPFIDRSFGPNFDPANEQDVEFLRRVSELDDLAIDLGLIKPTQMLGILRPPAGTSHATKCFRHWTPAFCVRDPALTVAVPLRDRTSGRE